jgi:class 3 adenylate cyclase
VLILRFLFRRLGRAYLLAALAATFATTSVVAIGAVGMLALYSPPSPAEFGRIVAVTQGLVLLEIVVGLIQSWGQLRPARRWIAGRGDAMGAWRALILLPRSHLRRFQLIAPLVSVAPACAYIAWELDASWMGLLALLAGGLVVIVYGLLFRVLALELLMRPPVAAAAREVTDDGEARGGSLGLRFKLVACLPLVNVVTGVAVAGLSSPEGGLKQLGLAVALAVGFSFTVTLLLTLLLAGSILGPLKELRRAAARVGEGELDARVPVTSTDETGELAESFNAMVQGLGERERLREAFGAFVDPGLTDRVLEEGTSLGGEEVEVSVLFMDAVGFSSFSEEVEAAGVVTELNEIFERAVPIVLEHGGHVDKFVGDGLIAVFGAPERLDDHAERAVAAGIEIVRALGERTDGRLAVAVGINSGRVIAGTLGGGGRLDFTVIGRAVNVAARVEELTRQTGDSLLITDETHRRLSGDGDGWRRRDGLQVEGVSEELVLWAPAEA